MLKLFDRALRRIILAVMAQAFVAAAMALLFMTIFFIYYQFARYGNTWQSWGNVAAAVLIAPEMARQYLQCLCWFKTFRKETLAPDAPPIF